MSEEGGISYNDNGGCFLVILILLLVWGIPATAVPIINALNHCPAVTQ